MALSSWWRGDKLPQLRPIANFHVENTAEIQLLTKLTGLVSEELVTRLRDGHRPYVAFLNEIPVAYGWAAVRQASIGELGLTFSISAANRYLWDFKTIPAWRGRGIYPHLLQTILKLQMQAGANRFWIINAPENSASGIGIARAGFQMVGELLFSNQGSVVLIPEASSERVEEGATLLNVSTPGSSKTALAACCWQCVILPNSVCNCASCSDTGSEIICDCVHLGLLDYVA